MKLALTLAVVVTGTLNAHASPGPQPLPLPPPIPAPRDAAFPGSAGAKDPIELVLQNGDRFLTVRIDYHGGLRYPHLERDATRPALLDDILAARKS